MGVQPDLALVYNSNDGNGMLGLGLELSGLTAISRDTVYKLTYTTRDHFTGPGGKLIQVTDNDYSVCIILKRRTIPDTFIMFLRIPG